MRRHIGAALFVLLFAIPLAGCGDDATAGDGAKPGPASDFDKQLAFAKCMRDNGVDMPDPKEGPDGAVELGVRGAGPDDPAFATAYEKCRGKLPNGGVHTMSPGQRQKQLEFAKCMRDNGIADYPDPPADGRPAGRQPLPDPADPGYAAALERFQQAAEKCGLPAGVLPAQPVQPAGS
jgi:hypothetical protein